MNAKLSATALERALVVRLRDLLGSVDWLRGPEVEPLDSSKERGFDLLAKVPLPEGGVAALCVECKMEMRPSSFSMLAKREFKPGGRPKVIVPVLALPWVSPRVAELCQEHGWSWYDLAGNCRIDVPGLLHLSHTGNAPVHVRSRPTANLGTKEAGRVVRALLTPCYGTDHEWTQRALNLHCHPNVSLGLVNKVVRHLRDEGYLEPLPGGRFKVKEPAKLLMAWRDAYRFDQHERLGYFTLLQGKSLQRALGKFHVETSLCAYAAFSAADQLAPNVRQPKTWIYLMSRDLERFAEMADAKQVDSGGNLEVLVTSDEGVFFQPEFKKGASEPEMPSTSFVQTYVDLWHCGGRGREAAEALFNQRLKPLWQFVGPNT